MPDLLPPPGDLPFCQRFPSGHEAGIQMCKLLASSIRSSRQMAESSAERIDELLLWLKQCLDRGSEVLATQAKEHLSDARTSLAWNRRSAATSLDLADRIAPPNDRCLSCALDDSEQTTPASNSSSQKV